MHLFHLILKVTIESALFHKYGKNVIKIIQVITYVEVISEFHI